MPYDGTNIDTRICKAMGRTQHPSRTQSVLYSLLEEVRSLAGASHITPPDESSERLDSLLVAIDNLHEGDEHSSERHV